MVPFPQWLVERADVVHATFGTGRVVNIGELRGQPAIWIDFDAGMRKAFDPEYLVPHLRPRTSSDATTPPDPAERCDYCGKRPVVWSITGPKGTHRSCDVHHRTLTQDLQAEQ